MKKERLILAVAIAVLGAAGICRADIASPRLPVFPEVAGNPSYRAPVEAASVVNAFFPMDAAEPVSGLEEGSALRGKTGRPGNSVVLVLGSFGVIGAWRFGWSARRIQFAPAPDWFHAEAPAQIGHRVAAGPSLQLDLALRIFDTVAAALAPIKVIARHDCPAISLQQFVLSVEGPRAPPARG